ncbi:MAG: M14 family zinc carboxypeptidase [Bacteroidota bacterium]|nr:M14 family zinc carboxypeptidase [Bacteroidota bacterium]
MDLYEIAERSVVGCISGRYVAPEVVCDFLQGKNNVALIGHSTQGRAIHQYTFGRGATKLLMWSQMHGNESTTTKAVLDLINFLESNQASVLKDKFTIRIIPMLNPDGALLWTRNNANDIDLNRDAQNLTQEESRILRRIIDDFSPDLCFNLHDQRTIFGLKETKQPATISFLSPSYNPQKEINNVRLKTMKYITIMNSVLQQHIAGQIGRFDDGFNINCIGDKLHSQGISTILIEAGHFPNDYNRDITRKYVLLSILTVLFNWDIKKNDEEVIKEYFNIFQNEKIFFDVIYKNVLINYENTKKVISFAVQMSESVQQNELSFVGKIAQVDNLEGYLGHQEFDLGQMLYMDGRANMPEVGGEANFTIGNITFENGFPK